MAIKLDLKDRKILYELDLNSRQPFAAIAKKVGLGKQTVINRVKKLESEGAIQKYLAIIDLAKLGYSGCKVFLRLQSADKQKIAEIASYLENHPNVQWACSTDGNFDLNFNIFARNNEELDGYLKELNNHYGKFIGEREVMALTFGKFYLREYLVGSSESRLKKPLYFGTRKEGGQEPEIDGKDRIILSSLGKDARADVKKMAHAASLSPDAVRLRIRKLEKAGIIQNYVLVLGNSALGQMNYKVLFRLENLDERREKAFEEYLRAHPNVWFSSKGIGRYDEEMNVEVKSQEEFRSVMNGIKERFSGIVRDYTVLSIYSIDKFDFYPFAIGKKN